MKKRGVLFVLLIVFILVFSSVAVEAGRVKDDLSKRLEKKGVDDEVRVIVKLKSDARLTDLLEFKALGADIKKKHKLVKAISGRIKKKDIERLIQQGLVDEVEPDYEVKISLDSSIPSINANKVWSNSTGEGVQVGVLDTGVNPHAALRLVKSVDFTDENTTDDLHGHGTHVAGIIGSHDSTYRGVAPNSQIVNIKVLKKEGFGYASDIIEGIEWAAANRVSVISLSIGAPVVPCDGTDAMSQAIDSAVSQGVVAIVAAGNNGPNASTITSPGCAKNAITIGAVTDNGQIASFSSRGPTADGRFKPDFVAPGVSITSTTKDGLFATFSGTSMATPHVSGIVALMLSKKPTLNRDEIKTALVNGVKPVQYSANDAGFGYIDALKAYSSAVPPPATLPLSPAPNQTNYTQPKPTNYTNATQPTSNYTNATQPKPPTNYTNTTQPPSNYTNITLPKPPTNFTNYTNITRPKFPSLNKTLEKQLDLIDKIEDLRGLQHSLEVLKNLLAEKQAPGLEIAIRKRIENIERKIKSNFSTIVFNGGKMEKLGSEKIERSHFSIDEKEERFRKEPKPLPVQTKPMPPRILPSEEPVIQPVPTPILVSTPRPATVIPPLVPAPQAVPIAKKPVQVAQPSTTQFVPPGQRKKACLDIIKPVCGKDKKTYRNTCIAENEGTEVEYNSECKKASVEAKVRIKEDKSGKEKKK